MEAGARRKVLLLPFVFFAAVLTLAIVLAVSNRGLGSVNMLPGEHLRLPAALMIFSYAWMLSRHLRRAGLLRPEHGRFRASLVAASSVVAAPVFGLLIAPAINGLAGLGEEVTVLAPVVRIEARYMRHGRRLYYYARIAEDAALPRGAYYLGRYDQSWAPMYENEPLERIHTVRIRYRTGLLGARTLLEAVPVSASLP